MQVEDGGRVTSFPVNARRIGECAGFHAAREPDREAAVHGDTRLTLAPAGRGDGSLGQGTAGGGGREG